MDTNGRSTAFITTGDAQRRALWLRLFGEEWLPVKAARCELNTAPCALDTKSRAQHNVMKTPPQY